MMKVTALYSPPTDVAAFEAHYTSVHMPLVATMPGLVRAETATVAGTPDGSPPPYHRTADLYFQSPEALQAAFASEAGQHTTKDAAELASRTGATLTVLICAVD